MTEERARFWHLEHDHPRQSDLLMFDEPRTRAEARAALDRRGWSQSWRLIPVVPGAGESAQEEA